jgi:hypothetical protein
MTIEETTPTSLKLRLRAMADELWAIAKELDVGEARSRLKGISSDLHAVVSTLSKEPK